MGLFRSPLISTESSETWLRQRRDDVRCLAIVLVACLTASTFAWMYDSWLGNLDIMTQFLPWYGYVGDRLGNGELPLWNPYVGSGEAVIGSPASGWLSIPVMLTFPFFEVFTAYKLLIAFHVLVAGFGMYFFARRIALGPIPSMIAAISFALGPLFYGAITFQPPAAGVLMLIPLAMLGAESSLRSEKLSGILGWSTVIGLCFSQMFVVSAPRLIYGVAFVGGWVVYRAVIAPAGLSGGVAWRIGRVAIVGAVSGVIASGLSSAAALPILVYSDNSHIPNADYSNVIGGGYASSPWSLTVIGSQLLEMSGMWRRPFFFGSGLLILAMLAILVCRKQYGVPFFAGSLVVLFGIGWSGSFFRESLYQLPVLGGLIEHRPTSAIFFFAFPLPLMAAAGCQWLLTERNRHGATVLRLVPLALFLIAAYWLDSRHHPPGGWQVGVAVVATIFCLVPIALRWFRWNGITPGEFGALLAVIVLILPTGLDLVETLVDPDGSRKADVALAKDDSVDETLDRMMSRSDPGTAAEFLQIQRHGRQPFRIASWPGTDEDLFSISHYSDNVTLSLLLNGRAPRLELEQVSSYNPVHIGYYVDYLETMNQVRQDYHLTDVRFAALNISQLFDMLNVRYIVVPTFARNLPELLSLNNLVYSDAEVRVFENPGAFNRVWIAHELRAADGDYLNLMNSYLVDGRHIAYVEGSLPSVRLPEPGSTADSVLVTSYRPESIHISAKSAADGLLVLSEIYLPGWNAYVDGKKTDVLRVDHAFRGVALTAGEHEVVLKYEPESVTVGLWITGATTGVSAGIWMWAAVDRRRHVVWAEVRSRG